MYTIHLVVTDEVTEAERDEYLRLFSHRESPPGDATRWLGEWMKDTRMKQQNIEDLGGYDEMFQKLVEAMPVEKRLAGLAPEQLILALPVDVLRQFPEEYLRSLPPPIEEEIRRRLTSAAG